MLYCDFWDVSNEDKARQVRIEVSVNKNRSVELGSLQTEAIHVFQLSKYLSPNAADTRLAIINGINKVIQLLECKMVNSCDI